MHAAGTLRATRMKRKKGKTYFLAAARLNSRETREAIWRAGCDASASKNMDDIGRKRR